MNENDIITRLQDKYKLPLSMCRRLLDSFKSSIFQGIVDDGVVRMRGFGTFKATHHKARYIRSNITGKKLRIREHWTITFDLADRKRKELTRSLKSRKKVIDKEGRKS